LGGQEGGTGGSLRFDLINLWQQGFTQGQLGYASALAWIFVVAAAVIILAIFRTSGRWVYYEDGADRI
ncbi:MAG: ABC transporter permease, partial [Gemmatimonadaceae bacterium]|nr:ABC transporter permease [Gemmatimonadaceae bacterium]